MSDAHKLDDISAGNAQSLRTLQRALANSQGRFSLILVRCNYDCLRKQILNLLDERCSLNIKKLSLEPSAKTLYTTILAQFGQKKLNALMIFGLELVIDLDGLLAATNNVRDSFLCFTFPVALWVTDGVLRKLRRQARDFINWASPTVEFKLPAPELMALLRENAEQAFANNPEFSIDSAELDAAQQDLQDFGQEFEPELKASLAFISGLNYSQNSQFDEAINQYHQSLCFWEENHQLEQGGVILCHLALAYYLKGKDYHKETKIYIQKCLDILEQANRPDLLVRHINQLGEMLRKLGEWKQLKVLAGKAISLYQTRGEIKQVAQDYSFLAEVAIKNSGWNEAKIRALQALDILEKLSNCDSHTLGLNYFILAKSQRQLHQTEEAVKNLEKAQIQVKPEGDPSLYVEILEELRTLQFEQGKYLEAFQLKLKKREIESQYGLRAFIGAGRLQPPRQVITSGAGSLGENRDLSLEEIVAASGRQKDVEELIERIRNRHRKLTVIYGPSGVGKSSIVQAALVPALQKTYFEGRDFLPVLVQVYKDWVGTLDQSLTRAIEQHRSRILEAGLVDKFKNQLEMEEKNSPSLNFILKKLQLVEHDNVVTVLIFDQFEEFFFDNKDRANRRVFYTLLCQCFEIPYLKIILSIREDYLHYLLEFVRISKPQNIDANYEDILYYLGNFSPMDAKAVIQRLTSRSTVPLAPDLVKQLVKDLAKELEEVRPIELQVVGAQLESEKITTLKQYQQLGAQPQKKLVENFLEAVVKDCGKENSGNTHLVLYLLTNENNTRPLKTQVELEEDLERVEQLNLVLKILEGSGLVFRVPGVPADRYQLVHDYLVSFIRQKYQDQTASLDIEFKQTKQQLKEALRRLTEALEEEKKRQRAEIQSVIAQCNASKAFLLFGQKIEALVAAVKAGKQVKEANLRETDVMSQSVVALVSAVYSMGESQHLARLDATSVSFSPDHQTLAIASKDRTVRLWTRDGREIATFSGHNARVESVSFSPDGQTLASASSDKTVKLWTKNGNLITTLVGHERGVESVSFSLDGQLASASWDTTVKLWTKDGVLITTLFGHRSWVNFVSFSPDGQTLASASWDKTVKLWTKDGTLTTTLSGHDDTVRSVSFSPNGQILASASSDKTVKLWKQDGTLISTLVGHRRGVNSVSFSPDGQTLASAGRDGTVKLWNQNGTLISTLVGYSRGVNSVSFSPDGQILACTSEDGTVQLLDFDLDKLLAHGCRLLNDNDAKLTEEERHLCNEIGAQK